RDALRLAVLRREHAMRPPPALGDRLFLLGVLRRHLLRGEEVLERVGHAREGGAHVARLLDRPLDDLDADGHQSPDSGSSRAARRGVLISRSFSTSRASRREYAGLITRPRSSRTNRITTAATFSRI